MTGYAPNRGMTLLRSRRRKELGTARVFVGIPIGQSARPHQLADLRRDER